MMVMPDGDYLNLPSNTVVVWATSANGSFSGSCVMSIGTKPGGCSIDVPFDTDLVVSIDETSVPYPYVVGNNPQYFHSPATASQQIGDVWFTFRFVETPVQTPAPVTVYPILVIPSGDAAVDLPTNTIAASAIGTDGTVYDTCLFSIGTYPSGCSLDVPADTDMTVVVDETTVPAGILVTDNNQPFHSPSTSPMHIGDLWFTFNWAGDANADPTVVTGANQPTGDADVDPAVVTGANQPTGDADVDPAVVTAAATEAAANQTAPATTGQTASAPVASSLPSTGQGTPIMYLMHMILVALFH